MLPQTALVAAGIRFETGLMPGFSRFEELLGRLGRYRTGKSCLYVKSLDDVDRDVLRRLIDESVAWMRSKYGWESAP